MLEYREAEALFATARVPSRGKPLENNTRLFKAEDEMGQTCYEVWLHGTPVVTIHKDGTYVLKTGGWHTLTTKDRLNKYGPGTVTQINRVWYWEPKREYKRNRDGEYKVIEQPVPRYYFHEGMRVTLLREVTGREEVLGPGRWSRY